jgi:flagellar biosynthesis component FlhA
MACTPLVLFELPLVLLELPLNMACMPPVLLELTHVLLELTLNMACTPLVLLELPLVETTLIVCLPFFSVGMVSREIDIHQCCIYMMFRYYHKKYI